MENKEYVILVNEYDDVIGSEEKIKAHQLALLHRAFSIFVYRKINGNFEFLLQQRHRDKYHCGGLWTNTCCGHPRFDEEVILAAQRRLKEEMLIDLPLIRLGSFRYRANFENGLSEHEIDHVLIGELGHVQTIVPNPIEVQDFCWLTVKSLIEKLNSEPEKYTPWFKSAFEIVLKHLGINKF